MSEQIQIFDKEIERMADETLPETQALVQVFGVGTLTAVTFVLTVGDKHGSQTVVTLAATWG
jgi:transposase